MPAAMYVSSELWLAAPEARKRHEVIALPTWLMHVIISCQHEPQLSHDSRGLDPLVSAPFPVNNN